MTFFFRKKKKKIGGIALLAITVILMQSETEAERSWAQNQWIIKSRSLLNSYVNRWPQSCGGHNMDIKKRPGECMTFKTHKQNNKFNFLPVSSAMCGCKPPHQLLMWKIQHRFHTSHREPWPQRWHHRASCALDFTAHTQKLTHTLSCEREGGWREWSHPVSS